VRLSWAGRLGRRCGCGQDGIWFTGHGHNGQIGALSSFRLPGFTIGANTVEITRTPQ
jgi:hypothetical protein